MITILGQLSFAAAIPLLSSMQAGMSASADISMADLNAQLLGLQNILAAITLAPPDLAGTIQAAIANVVSLQASISGPTVTLQPISILAKIGEITAQLELITSGLAALVIPAGGAAIYVYAGALGSLGSQLQAAINATLPGGQGNALVLVTTNPADWAALSQIFKVSP